MEPLPELLPAQHYCQPGAAASPPARLLPQPLPLALHPFHLPLEPVGLALVHVQLGLHNGMQRGSKPAKDVREAATLPYLLAAAYLTLV